MNFHVVEKNAKLGVSIKDSDSIINTTLIAFSSGKDIAVIKFESDKYIPALTFADSEKLSAGSFVLAIGSPYGSQLYGTATFGIVSFPKRYIDEEVANKIIVNEYIQHDAAINSGNSGGPLVNMKGEIVGINTMKIAFSGEWNEGIGFSIPSNVIKEFINENVK